jgi:hypothetical protein
MTQPPKPPGKKKPRATPAARPKRPAPARKKSVYSPHPSLAMEAAFEAKLPEKTGRSLAQWIAFLKKNGPSGEKERREWLQKHHGLGTNYAWWIAERSMGGKSWAESYDPDALVLALFSGGKAPLRPIYEKLLGIGLALGDDVRACPCETMVPLYRKHVFAQLKPPSRTRIDLGLALGDTKATGRLVDTGGFAKKDRITHRIPITSLEEIDDEVVRWMKIAYARP